MLDPPPTPLLSSLSRLISRCKTIRQLQQIHSQILTTPNLNLDPASISSLLSRLLFSLVSSLPSSLSYAASLFVIIPSPTIFAYNALIRAHSNSLSSSSSSLDRPISLYSRMLASGIRPDYLTFPFLIKCCAHHRSLPTGQALHSHIFKLGHRCDIFIQNSLIFMYSACMNASSARKAFDEMIVRDIVSANSMLTGYLRCGELDAALGLFADMEERNVRTWNSIIAGFVQGGRCKEALDLFHEMLLYSGDGAVKPDKVTVANVVGACASLGALDQGEWLHGYLRRQGLEVDMVMGTALIDMYGKCGCVKKAYEVFHKMPRRDVLAWTAMISALAVHGHGEEAFALLEEMEEDGVRPNHVTFGALLSACAHSGMVEKGRWCFDTMKRIYSIEPQLQHYACMVDLLGRAGLFEEAEGLIGCMSMEPDLFVWGALLGACRMHGNVELGERVAGYMISLDPLNHAYYIILSDIYANAKRFEDVKKIRDFMKDHGIKKTSPGSSLLEVDGRMHEFSVKGLQQNIELAKEIEWVLNGIHGELTWRGCVIDDNIGSSTPFERIIGGCNC